MPLSHISITDFARSGSRPTCVRQLVDLGAPFIKIEHPQDER
jgi:crotonobetainyl-CoA:carnitine CoA-transferase CaiB-like acyl-CoA transferase